MLHYNSLVLCYSITAWYKELSRSARRSFRRMILSSKVFSSVKIQKNTQFTLLFIMQFIDLGV